MVLCDVGNGRDTHVEEDNLLLTCLQLGQSLEAFGIVGFSISDTKGLVRLAPSEENDR